MTTRAIRLGLVSLLAAPALIIGAVGRAFAAPPAEKGPPEALLKKMLEAIKTGAYGDFMAETDDKMKAGLTPQMFEGVSGQLAPRMRVGYKTVYFGKLNQKEHTTFVWKLSFEDGKEESLVKMSIKNGLVSGFWIQ